MERVVPPVTDVLYLFGPVTVILGLRPDGSVSVSVSEPVVGETASDGVSVADPEPADVGRRSTEQAETKSRPAAVRPCAMPSERRRSVMLWAVE